MSLCVVCWFDGRALTDERDDLRQRVKELEAAVAMEISSHDKATIKECLIVAPEYRRSFCANDYGVTVYAYQTELGGVYYSEATALRVSDGPVHALVRFSDVADKVTDGQKICKVRHAISNYYAEVKEGNNARVARDVAFLAIEEILGMTPNDHPNRTHPRRSAC